MKIRTGNYFSLKTLILSTVIGLFSPLFAGEAAFTEQQLSADWIEQDTLRLKDRGLGSRPLFSSPSGSQAEAALLSLVLEELPAELSESLMAEKRLLEAEKAAGADPRWLQLYLQSCRTRREQRLAGLYRSTPSLILVSGYNINPSFFAYTEGLSDAQHERSFLPGSTLEQLVLKPGAVPERRILIKDTDGVLRDPELSWEGDRLLFAWKKNLNKDDYHLYEMDLKKQQVRQITRGLGFADYEPVYLPDDSILFSSTRCVQTVDCWWTEVSNLYICDKDGGAMRRVGYDQVHTIYPKVLDDGRVIYTRWEYNDRGQVFPQSLFQMSADGSGQEEFYGNNSWFPTTISHARGIPGTREVLAVAMGHHTPQMGKLIRVNPEKGRQENEGVHYTAPDRAAKPVRIDAFGQDGALFQYPFPINDDELITGWSPNRSRQPPVRFSPDNSEGRLHRALFGIYWFHRDGRRELLALDPEVTLKQAIPLRPRVRPQIPASQLDYSKETGTVYLHEIDRGEAMKGIAKGTVKSIRIVELQFRSSGVGYNHNYGEAGNALVSTPIARPNGSWDVKRVLAEYPVDSNGSLSFELPARTPLYFQSLDGRGRVVQTMRSWVTLQPGERVSCIGCHEDKNMSPDYRSSTISGESPLQWPPEGSTPTRSGFSFVKEIQPILDRNCISCHNSNIKQPPRQGKMRNKRRKRKKPGSGFQLMDREVKDITAGRVWSRSYLNLTEGDGTGELVNWISSQSVPQQLPAASAGSITSGLVRMLEEGHYGVKLTDEELRTIMRWIDLGVPFCGSYEERALWNEREWERFRHFEEKRKRSEKASEKAIEEWLNGVKTTVPAWMPVEKFTDQFHGKG